MAVLLVCAFAGGCSKVKKVTEAEPVEPAPEALATPSPAPQKRSTPVAIFATPVPKRLAPEGVYFLVQKKSLETSDGIIGFKPGTTVTKQANGTYLAEGKVLTLRPEEVTNDLDIAARVAGMDAQRQNAIRQVAAVHAAPATASSVIPAANSSAPPTATTTSYSQAPSATPPPASSSSSLGGGSALGDTHTMTRDGWLWEKNQWGAWRRVRPLR